MCTFSLNSVDNLDQLAFLSVSDLSILMINSFISIKFGQDIPRDNFRFATDQLILTLDLQKRKPIYEIFSCTKGTDKIYKRNIKLKRQNYHHLRKSEFWTFTRMESNKLLASRGVSLSTLSLIKLTKGT